jgi:hypothetical protein
MARTLTRRQALAAGAAGVAAALVGGAGLVQAEVLPGRYRAGRLLGACDLGGLPPTTVAPGPLRFASFPSQRRRHRVGYGVAWPPGSGLGDRLGVCLLLHAAAGAEVTDAGRLTGIAVRVDRGANDPFTDVTRALAAALPAAEAAVTKGCHDGGFWQHLARPSCGSWPARSAPSDGAAATATRSSAAWSGGSRPAARPTGCPGRPAGAAGR